MYLPIGFDAEELHSAAVAIHDGNLGDLTLLRTMIICEGAHRCQSTTFAFDIIRHRWRQIIPNGGARTEGQNAEIRLIFSG